MLRRLPAIVVIICFIGDCGFGQSMQTEHTLQFTDVMEVSPAELSDFSWLSGQ